jgi:hypothetical protein
LKTGAKANVNGISSAVANTFTLGYVDSVEPWAVYEDDINGGYGTALMFARGGGELLLIAAPTGVASLAAHGGRMGKAAVYTGYGLRGVDAVSNWHDAGEASVDIVRNGASLQNTAQLGMSTLGMSFDIYDGVQMLDKAGYKVTISGASMGLPLQIGKKKAPTSASAIGNDRYRDKIDELVASSKASQSHLADLPSPPVRTPSRLSQHIGAAEALGYRQTNHRSHGQPVFTNGSTFITPDVDGHNVSGGWKMAATAEGLRSKMTRMGTYGPDLTRIGD